MKNIRKQTIGRIEKYFEWHFPIFQTLKNYPKNTNKPKFKKFKKPWKEASTENIRKQVIVRIEKILRNIFKNFNTTKMTQKELKNQIKKLNNHVRRPQIKNQKTDRC